MKPWRNIRWRSEDLAKVEGDGCRNTKQNRLLASRAWRLLSPEATTRFAFLFSPRPRITHLAALGRIESPDFLKVVAVEICRREMKIEKAACFIRQVRGRTHKEPPKLSDYVVRAIRQYRELWPEAAAQLDIPALLEGLAMDYREREGGR